MSRPTQDFFIFHHALSLGKLEHKKQGPASVVFYLNNVSHAAVGLLSIYCTVCGEGLNV